MVACNQRQTAVISTTPQRASTTDRVHVIAYNAYTGAYMQYPQCCVTAAPGGGGKQTGAVQRVLTAVDQTLASISLSSTKR